MASPRAIIAMKGPPYTRKTEFATLIAKSLKCPVLSLDDVLDALSPDKFPTAALEPHDVAFQIICQMAKSHLQKQVSDHVVIDSPLSSQSHLHLLIKLADSLAIFSQQSRLVIVECKPQNTYSWKLKFESYLLHNLSYTRKWYKPKNGDDLEMSIQNNCDEILGFAKMVLDPDDIPIFFGIGTSEHPPFNAAIQYMTTRKKGEDPNTVVYRQWRQSQYVDGDQLAPKKQWFCRDGHCISSYSKQGLVYEPNCMGCKKEVKGAAYTCKDCSLALHKDCAESFDINEGSKRVCLSEIPVSQMHACTRCKEDLKLGSFNCAACLFETNLKLRAMPIVIRHECEQHFLSLVIPPVKHEGYLCAACGDSEMSDSYSCKICNFAYHFECLKAPSRLKHVHGGHHHTMLLNLWSEEGEEDYMCQECQEKRDPQLWSYSCEDCPYEAHLYCIVQREERLPLPLPQTLTLRMGDHSIQSASPWQPHPPVSAVTTAPNIQSRRLDPFNQSGLSLQPHPLVSAIMTAPNIQPGHYRGSFTSKPQQSGMMDPFIQSNAGHYKVPFGWAEPMSAGTAEVCIQID